MSGVIDVSRRVPEAMTLLQKLYIQRFSGAWP
jgi:hypothetical protein